MVPSKSRQRSLTVANNLELVNKLAIEAVYKNNSIVRL